MIKLFESGCYLAKGRTVLKDKNAKETLLAMGISEEELSLSRDNTMAYRILSSHNTSSSKENMALKFDAMASHDITYVNIILTALASKMKEFPLPYVLTNCHNSLCAVGGTINEDDHVFGLCAAKKFGGEFVPAHVSVIHQYMREMHAKGEKMILGSDSHTRYGALGTLGVGEGGGELAKQLLSKTYDLKRPLVVGVNLKGRPRHGVGPQDVALLLVGATFKTGFVKNKVLEFFGEGVKNLSMDFRMGVDVMTTETSCLSSIWTTDEKTEEYFAIHNRKEDFVPLSPGSPAEYDSYIEIDLDKVKPMIALPFHPSNVFSIEEFNQNTEDIVASVEKNAWDIFGKENTPSLSSLLEGGRLRATQAVIAGCSGGLFENICAASDILEQSKGGIGQGELSLNVYPASLPIYNALIENHVASTLLGKGAVIKTAFCGPCFGAGDVPRNGGFSVRHTTRNFPNREGSKPSEGQGAFVALMDARSIAATAMAGGFITGADTIDYEETIRPYSFDENIYSSRVYHGWGHPEEKTELKFGPNIKPWPEMEPLGEDILLKVVSSLTDEVTTTDELIPSGETSSLRSNPLRLAEYALSRRDPQYVPRAKALREEAEKYHKKEQSDEISSALLGLAESGLAPAESLSVLSAIFARKPGDGSAREQAASCQRVLGGGANFAHEYATKRYRSNLINWGMIPFLLPKEIVLKTGDWVFVPQIKKALSQGESSMEGYVISNGSVEKMLFSVGELTHEEREILLCGSIINYYKK